MPVKIRHASLNGRSSSLLAEIQKKAEQYSKARYVNVGVNSAEGVQKYGEGPANLATIAQYLEYGWVQSVTKKQSGWFFGQHGLGVPPGSVLFMPPRPFLRATMRHKADDWVQAVKQAFITYNGDLEKVLAYVGSIAAADIQNTIKTAEVEGEVFPRRSPLTMKLYEIYRENGKHKGDGTGGSYGDKPLYNTGALYGSIKFELVK